MVYPHHRHSHARPHGRSAPHHTTKKKKGRPHRVPRHQHVQHEAHCTGFEVQQWAWNATEWPRLVGGWRQHHASLTLETHHHDNSGGDGATQTPASALVVLGGQVQDGSITNSVLVLPIHNNNNNNNAILPSQQGPWQYGPPLHEQRYGLAAVVVPNSSSSQPHSQSQQPEDWILAIGGHTGSDILDTIECLPAQQLFQESPTASWQPLNTRLSSPRWGCAAVVVSSSKHHSYICVMGGNSGMNPLASMDICQLITPQSDDDSVPRAVAITVTPGPSMQVARWYGGAAAIRHSSSSSTTTRTSVYMVGGVDENGIRSNTVECLEWNVDPLDDNEELSDHQVHPENFSSFSWNLCPDLSLPHGLSGHAVVACPAPSCLIVAGGYNGQAALDTVHVVDPTRAVVWALPPLQVPRYAASLVSLSNQWLVVGGHGNSASQSLESLTYCPLEHAHQIPPILERARQIHALWTQQLHELNQELEEEDEPEHEEDDEEQQANHEKDKEQGNRTMDPLEPHHDSSTGNSSSSAAALLLSSRRRRRRRRLQQQHQSSTSSSTTGTTPPTATTRVPHTLPTSRKERKLHLQQQQRASWEWYQRLQTRFHTLVYYQLRTGRPQHVPRQLWESSSQQSPQPPAETATATAIDI